MQVISIIFIINDIGLIIPGGFGTRGVEGKIAATHWARTTNKPLLGICLGLQCAVIEFARNVLGKPDAHTTEINPDTTNPVVIDMPEHNPGDLGGTMRLGKRQTIFKTQDSILRQLYGNQVDIQCTRFIHILRNVKTQWDLYIRLILWLHISLGLHRRTTQASF